MGSNNWGPGGGGGNGGNSGRNWNTNIFDNMPNFMDMPYFSNSLRMNPPPPPPLVVNCGELRGNHEGKYVEITGRYVKKRLGRFAELRDRHGATQLVICEDRCPRIARRFANMPVDSTLTVIGCVVSRPYQSRNNSMPTGEIEVEVEDIVRIGKPVGRRGAEKRSYSTMAESRSTGITSTEYKIAKSDNILKYFDNRERTCNDLRREDVGKHVTLVGWMPSFTKSKFQQLKDGYGQTQILVEDKDVMQTIQCIPPLTVIQVKGKVLARPKSNVNIKYDTGEIEIFVEEVKVVSPDEPYEGPIKEKVAKLSIEDAELEEANGGDGQGVIAESVSDAASRLQKIADSNKFTCRTHTCGELNNTHINEKVVLCGWLEFQRMRKFLILRDGYGQTQVLLTDEVEGLNLQADDIPFESIVKIEGTVVPRPSNMINPTMKTGEIEVHANAIEIINEARKNLPIEMRAHNRAKEALRMEHRYIDLRFADMQRNLRTRSTVLMKMREYLINYLGFVEVETPTLFRRTPGGAQEFVVPTRKSGHFYSLVQSPQQFKQMLMAGAIDRYFQVARCYRDESTRPDRQPEFTQLDIELSFTTGEDIMKMIEEVLRYCWPKDLAKIELPFPRMTYEDAMSKYGCDKPDTRFELLLKDITETVKSNEDLASKHEDFAASVIVVKGNTAFMPVSVKREMEKVAKELNTCPIMIRKLSGNQQEIIDRIGAFIGKEQSAKICDQFSLSADDVIFLSYGPKREVQTQLGRVRLAYADILEENDSIPKRRNNQKFLWVVDFPLFERNPQTGEYETVHHPFTAPHEDDVDKLKAQENLSEIRSQAYDLVLNGQEVGGGSIRIHNRDLQSFVLGDILKIEHQHLEHLLNALQSGCPPHGGIALGIDRLMAIICKAKSIRDVIAFPKSNDGKDLLSKAPVPISEDELHLYNIKVVGDDDGATRKQE